MANQEQLKILNQGVEAWNKWKKDNPNVDIDLRGVHLVAANLRQANLSGVDLTGADLTRSDLTEANLMASDLSRAHLERANLRGADLTEADLERTELWDADLRVAILKGVDLRGADLTGTDLKKADFTNSELWNTTFGSNDLSSSIGLEKIKHWGASIIGIKTIRKSKGKIPTKFLRGCGLSDLEIESAKLAAPGLDPEQVAQITSEIRRLYYDQPTQFYSCFISYSSKDHFFAQHLYDDLQTNGVRCWFAPEDMRIGDEIRNAVGNEIRGRDKLLIILSENSVRSEWVGDEVEKALAEEKEHGALKLFPIRLDNAIFEAKDDWAEKIRLRRHVGDFSGDYAKAFQKLLQDLKQ